MMTKAKDKGRSLVSPTWVLVVAGLVFLTGLSLTIIAPGNYPDDPADSAPAKPPRSRAPAVKEDPGWAGWPGAVLASRFSGGDCGAKINAADAWLGDAPGEIWVDQACGTLWKTSLRFSGKRVLRFVQGGTYKVTKIVLPEGSNQLSIISSGPGMTVLEAASPNTPVIQCVQTGGAADSDYVSGISVRANAAGSTGPAIDVSGCRDSTFSDITYLSSGKANFASFFRFSSSPGYCYNNRIQHPIVTGQTGPATVFLFDNNGTRLASHNANVTYIDHVWIYNNTGIKTVFDARRSALTSITDGDIEANRGATVLIPGTLTSMSGVWLEANGKESVVGERGLDGSSNSVRLTGNFLGSPQEFSIGSGLSDWKVVGNVPAAFLTVEDNSGDPTNVIQKREPRGGR